MEQFIFPLIGGILIGLSSTIMLGGLGKITGISGIVGKALTKDKENTWRYTFLSGLIFGGILLKFLAPQLFSYQFPFQYGEAISAGLLVGFGTQLGSGCTSGHGVCGLPRLAKRSFVATCIFMATGILTIIIKGAL